jgi:hypothetical protein
MAANHSIISALARNVRRRGRSLRHPARGGDAKAGPADEGGFDRFARSLGSQVERRDVLQVALFGMVSTLLGSLGLKPAWAAANCLCGRQLYDTAIQCCTPTGVRPKHPIADLAGCPNRVPHPGYTCVPNGCGAAGGQAFPGSFGAANFLPCCDGHDCCWGTCNSDRNACDGAFLTCLQGACNSAYPPNIVLGVDVNRIRRGVCRAAADAYFRGVQTERWGAPAYTAAQQAACDCCATQNCVTCPGGTCSALPSCQDPGCVCFQTVEGVGFCHLPQLCAGLSSCATSAACPAGWACVSVTCCGSNPICIRPCFVVAGAFASPFGATPAGAGRMTAGPR